MEVKPKGKKTEEKEVVSFQNASRLMLETVFIRNSDPPLSFSVSENGRAHPKTVVFKDLPNGTRLIPPRDPTGLIDKGVVLLPAGAAPFRSQPQLIEDIRAFIHRYVDVPSFWEEMITHYVLMTWVYDRFSSIPYLRFLGEPHTGKTRCLQVAGNLCYKAIFAGGSTTASPFFRLLDVYRGTFVMDEADYKNSDLWSEIIKILNCGYMRGLPVLRSEKSGDGFEPRAYDVFGPKILTTRKEFQDRALETRCLTLRTGDRKIRPDIPRQLPGVFYSEALALRNKLLCWRFENFVQVQADESQLLDLNPRLSQIGAPLYGVSTDDGFRARLVTFLEEQAEEHRTEHPLAMVAEAIHQLLANGRNLPATLTVKEVCMKANSIRTDWQTDAEEFTPKRTGGLVRSLGFDPRRMNTGFQITVTKAKLADLVERYRPKSCPNREA